MLKRQLVGRLEAEEEWIHVVRRDGIRRQWLTAGHLGIRPVHGADTPHVELVKWRLNDLAEGPTFCGIQTTFLSRLTCAALVNQRGIGPDPNGRVHGSEPVGIPVVHTNVIDDVVLWDGDVEVLRTGTIGVVTVKRGVISR